MMWLIIIYATICFIHGLWALKMQKKFHPEASEWYRMLLVFVLNAVGFPIAFPWAILRIRSDRCKEG